MSDGINSLAVGQTTFPYSFQQVRSKVEPFLGLPEKIHTSYSAYDKVPRTNLDLPELYRGRNLYLRDTIDNLIIGDIDWYTTMCLPWTYTEETSITYSKWEFDHVLADRVPNEGISRLVTSHTGRFYGTIVRRGLAFILEGDFYNTPAGIESWARNCKGISQCVIETQAHDTINEILNCKQNERKWQEIFGHIPIDYTTIVQDEVNNFATVIKSQDDFRLLFFKHKRLLEKRNVTPDMLILPPECVQYLKMVGGEVKTAYYMAGPKGEMIKQQGPDATGLFEGVTVFETRDFDVYSNEPKIQLLTKPVTNGEYYFNSINDFRGGDFKNYLSKWRDMIVYDQNTDDWAKIKFRDQFLNAKIFARDGTEDKAMKNLIARARGEKKKPNLYSTNKSFGYNSDDEEMDPDADKHNEAIYFPLFTYDEKGDPEWARYLGQINLRGTTLEDFKNMAESIIGKFTMNCNYDNDVYNKLIDLLQKIESQPYDKGYFVALVRRNLAASMDKKLENFVGESVPSDLKQHWKLVDNIKEWTPNPFGSLNLPRDGVFKCTYPAGFNNWPGLLTLSAEAHCKESPWQSVGELASECVELIKRIVSKIKNVMPNSEMVNPKNRAPWFHMDDPCTTFMQLIANRDPIFLAALSPVNTAPTHNTEARTGSGGSNTVPSNILNIFGADSARGSSVEFENTDGSKITLPTSLLRTSVLPRGIAILANLGKTLYGNFKDLLGLLGNDEEKADFTSLIMKILSGKEGRKQAAKIIYSINTLPDNAQKKSKLQSLHSSHTPKAVKKVVDQILTEKNEFSLIVEDMIRGEVDADSRDNKVRTDLQSIPLYTNSAVFEALLSAFNDEKGALLSSSSVGIKALGAGLDLTKVGKYASLDPSEFPALQKAARAFIAQVEADGFSITDKEFAPAMKVQQEHDHLTSFNVKSNPADIMTASFFRTPLTMSMTLLESLAKEQVPVILPSDPASGHYAPYQSSGGRIQPEVWNRPQYATLDQLLHDPNKRDITLLGPIAKSSKLVDSKSTSKKIALKDKKPRSKLVDSSSDEESEEEGLSKFEPKMKDHDRTWTLQELKARESRKEDKHFMFEDNIYNSMYEKAYNSTFIKRYRDINRIADPITRLVALCCMWMPNNGHDWLHAIDNDVCVPINFILWRLNITHDMSTFVLMKSGIETGANFYGHSNFSIGTDVSTKMLMGNFTFHSKAMVYNPKNIQLMEALKPERYLGGNNTLFIKSSKDFDDLSLDRRSIISTAVPAQEGMDRPLPLVMSFTGRLPYSSYNEGINGPQTRPHYSTYQYYDREVYRLYYRVTERAIGRERFIDGINSVNVIALPGTQSNYNTRTGLYDKWKECRGHRGKNGSYPGAAAVWNGRSKSLEPFDGSKYRIE